MSRDIYWLRDKFYSSFLYARTQIEGVKKEHKYKHKLPGKLTISLTSYPKRYRTLSATIISLLNQTVSADEVVLWIADSQRQSLPESVTRLQGAGLSIRYCNDIRSYKKLIPLLYESREQFVVTADDDVYYQPDWLGKLVECYDGSQSIIAHRVHEICLDPDGFPLPYSEWKHGGGSNRPEVLNFATGVGGIMYPPFCLPDEALDIEQFQKLCPHADDVWFYWMSRRNGFRVRAVGAGLRFPHWPGSQLFGLHRINTMSDENNNDSQIRSMINVYGWSSI